MTQVKMLQRIAFLIMTSAAYVGGIRNTAAKEGSQSASKATTSTEHSRIHFQPSEFLDFTASDAGFSSSGNPSTSHIPPHPEPESKGSPFDERYPADAKFSFPSQHQSVAAAFNGYIGDKNYKLPFHKPNEVTTQLPSTPIRTYRDPYTNENFPSSGANMQEYTVHSTIQVQSPKVPPYRRIPTVPPPQAAASQFAYKYDNFGHSHDAHPNALPGPDNQLIRPSASSVIPPRISYASQDYPPQSFFLRPNQPPPPHRHEIPKPASPNYANNYNYYLQGERHEIYPPQNAHGVYAQPTYRPQFGARPPPPDVGSTRPSLTYNPNTNLHNYQLQGEVAPSPGNAQHQTLHLNRPGTEQQPQAAGVASLFSLLSSTQQYAPQIAQLGSMLGVFSGTSGAAATPPPVNTQLIKALENIARNDDLQCVPNVLCQLIAGQTQRGQLPTFLTSPAITSFLASFPASSPVLIYGRAALLGMSGGRPSCVQTYARCPKREDEILFYLNNHRGGFFKFFSEPGEVSLEQQKPTATSSSSSFSFLNILSLLTGNSPTTPPPPSPKPRPTKATTDNTSSIGNFLSSVLSGYVSNVEHQRRGRREIKSLGAVSGEKAIHYTIDFRGDEIHDRESSRRKMHNPVAESRIMHKELSAMDRNRKPTFFPQSIRLERNPKIADGLRYPHPATERVKFNIADGNQKSVGQPQHHPHNFSQGNANKEHFNQIPDDKRDPSTDVGSIVVTDRRRGVRMIYTGSIDDFARSGRILNRPSYPPTIGDFFGGGEQQHATDSTASNTLQSSRPQPLNYNCYNSNSLNNYSAQNYQNTKDRNCGEKNRYMSTGNQRQRTTPRPREDDKNVYVTNSEGVNEYYVTPEGKRVYF